MILYSKTADVEKFQQQLQQQGAVAHHQLTEEAQKKREVEKSQVQKSPEGQGGKVERKKDGEGGRGGQQHQFEDEEKNKKFGPRSGRSIDIRI